MFSLRLHFKEFQPIYAYKGYIYNVKSVHRPRDKELIWYNSFRDKRWGTLANTQLFSSFTRHGSHYVMWILHEKYLLCQDRVVWPVRPLVINSYFSKFHSSSYSYRRLWVSVLTLPATIPEEERKSTWIFIFTLLCAASKKKCENKNLS